MSLDSCLKIVRRYAAQNSGFEIGFSVESAPLHSDLITLKYFLRVSSTENLRKSAALNTMGLSDLS